MTGILLNLRDENSPTGSPKKKNNNNNNNNKKKDEPPTRKTCTE